MKHTFALIDKLIILIKDVPRSIESTEGKKEARKLLAEIKEYTTSLKKLIDNHKDRAYLERLHQSHIDKIEDWADQVTELFNKFDRLLANIEHDVELMENVIENEPEKWLSLIGDMALGMVMTGLHDEEEEMHRFRNIAIFEMHELKGILSAEHIAEIEEVIKLME